MSIPSLNPICVRPPCHCLRARSPTILLSIAKVLIFIVIQKIVIQFILFIKPRTRMFIFFRQTSPAALLPPHFGLFAPIPCRSTMSHRRLVSNSSSTQTQPLRPEVNLQTRFQHLFALWKTNGLSAQSFQVRSQIQIESFNMSGVWKTNPVKWFRN